VWASSTVNRCVTGVMGQPSVHFHTLPRPILLIAARRMAVLVVISRNLVRRAHVTNPRAEQIEHFMAQYRRQFAELQETRRRLAEIS